VGENRRVIEARSLHKSRAFGRGWRACGNGAAGHFWGKQKNGRKKNPPSSDRRAGFFKIEY
jgi:hypothetical protein